MHSSNLVDKSSANSQEEWKVEKCRKCGHELHEATATKCTVCHHPLGQKYWGSKTQKYSIIFLGSLAIVLLANFFFKPDYSLPSRGTLFYWGPPCQYRLVSQQIAKKIRGIGEDKFHLQLLDVYGNKDAYSELIDGQISVVMHEKNFLDKHYEEAEKRGVILKSERYAIDGIAYIANKDVEVQHLSVDDITQIYSGKITNWNQLDGKEQVIRPILLGGLGANSIFLPLNNLNPNNIYAKNRLEAMDILKKTPGSFFYTSASLAAWEKGVKIIPLYNPGRNGKEGRVVYPVVNGVPNLKAFINQSYPQLRGLFIAYRGNLKGEEKKKVEAFRDMLLSPQGQTIVKEAGFLPVGLTLKEKRNWSKIFDQLK